MQKEPYVAIEAAVFPMVYVLYMLCAHMHDSRIAVLFFLTLSHPDTLATWPRSGVIRGRRVRRGGKINSSNNQKDPAGGVCPRHRQCPHQCLRQLLQRGLPCLRRLQHGGALGQMLPLRLLRTPPESRCPKASKKMRNTTIPT